MPEGEKMNHLFHKNLPKDLDSSEDFSELLPLADICKANRNKR